MAPTLIGPSGHRDWAAVPGYSFGASFSEIELMQ
jgi:hypothetical protein